MASAPHGARAAAAALLLLPFAVSAAGTGTDYLGTAPQGDASAAAKLAKTRCAGCHGPKGNSVAAMFPELAGQNYNYLLKQLEDFRSGERKGSPMNTLVKALPKAPHNGTLRNIARFYSEQSLNRRTGARAHGTPPAHKSLEAGAHIFRRGLPAEGVPACAACHGAAGAGNAPMAVPALAGQSAQYTQTQLENFASGKRGNSPAHVMQTVAAALSADDIKAVAGEVEMLRRDALPGASISDYSAWVKTRDAQSVPGVASSRAAGPAGQ